MIICTDLLTFTLDGLEKYMMQEFLEIPPSQWNIVSLLEDPAHPLLSWVMKAYIDNGHLSRDQQSFSHHPSRVRVVVKDAYRCIRLPEGMVVMLVKKK